MVNLKEICNLLNNSNFRMQFLRLSQYFSLFIANYFKDKDLKNDLKYYSDIVQKYRKLLRIFYFVSLINQYYQIRKKDQKHLLMNISKIGFIIYYIFDNMRVYIKYFNKNQNDIFKRYCLRIYFISCILNLIYSYFNYFLSLSRENKLPELIDNRVNSNECLEILKNLDKERKYIFITITITTLNLILCSHFLKIPEILIKIKISEPTINFIGLISSLFENYLIIYKNRNSNFLTENIDNI